MIYLTLREHLKLKLCLDLPNAVRAPKPQKLHTIWDPGPTVQLSAFALSIFRKSSMYNDFPKLHFSSEFKNTFHCSSVRDGWKESVPDFFAIDGDNW